MGPVFALRGRLKQWAHLPLEVMEMRREADLQPLLVYTHNEAFGYRWRWAGLSQATVHTLLVQVAERPEPVVVRP